MDREFWRGKKVLVTGHTGFKGSWLCIWLLELGATVIGYSLNPKQNEDNFILSQMSDRLIDVRGDIRDRAMLQKTVQKYQPEIIFHLAAQAIVLESYEQPYETYEINVMGTLNVLEVIRHAASVRTAVLITTDKCYENKETLEGYKENDPFGGFDPYSSSKACDEILIASYRNSFFNLKDYERHHKSIASVRAGNVIGGGDWSKNRILPDCIRAIEAGEAIGIRNHYSIRPWQHVLEPLSGYLLLAEKLYDNPEIYSGGWNFGPDSDGIWSVWDIAKEVVRIYGKGVIEDHTQLNAVHEAKKLQLNIEKAKTQLGWNPRLDVKTAIEWTVEWYKKRNTESAYDICKRQIEKYEQIIS